MGLAGGLLSTSINAVSYPALRPAGKAAFFMFCRPFQRVAVREAERDVHDRATVESLRVNGKDVRTYRWGAGDKPVLLVHGWQSRGSRFAAHVPEIESLGFGAVTFDAPGHGDSGGNTTTILEYCDIIRQLSDRFGGFSAIVGHSFGLTCAAFALRCGAYADRLISISGVCDFSHLVVQFSDQVGLNQRVQTDLRRRIEEQLFASQPDIWRRFSADYEPDSLTMPILVIHDEKDNMVPLAQADKIVAAYGPRARMIVTKGLGHRRILSDRAVLDAAVAFLADAAPSKKPASASAMRARRLP